MRMQMEMQPKSLLGDCVAGLFKINESSVQPGGGAWLNGAGSVLQDGWQEDVLSPFLN